MDEESPGEKESRDWWISSELFQQLKRDFGDVEHMDIMYTRLGPDRPPLPDDNSYHCRKCGEGLSENEYMICPHCKQHFPVAGEPPSSGPSGSPAPQGPPPAPDVVGYIVGSDRPISSDGSIGARPSLHQAVEEGLPPFGPRLEPVKVSRATSMFTCLSIPKGTPIEYVEPGEGDYDCDPRLDRGTIPGMKLMTCPKCKGTGELEVGSYTLEETGDIRTSGPIDPDWGRRRAEFDPLDEQMKRAWDGPRRIAESAGIDLHLEAAAYVEGARRSRKTIDPELLHGGRGMYWAQGSPDPLDPHEIEKIDPSCPICGEKRIFKGQGGVFVCRQNCEHLDAPDRNIRVRTVKEHEDLKALSEDIPGIEKVDPIPIATPKERGLGVNPDPVCHICGTPNCAIRKSWMDSLSHHSHRTAADDYQDLVQRHFPMDRKKRYLVQHEEGSDMVTADAEQDRGEEGEG